MVKPTTYFILVMYGKLSVVRKHLLTYHKFCYTNKMMITIVVDLNIADDIRYSQQTLLHVNTQNVAGNFNRN